MLSLPLSSLLTPLLHEGIENGVVSRFFFYDKQLGHCDIKPSKRNTPISPFGEESEKQRENGSGDKGKHRWRRQRQGKVVWVDVDSGVRGCCFGGDGDPQAQRQAHLQPPC